MAHTAAKYGGIIASGLHTAARYVETAAIWVKNHAMSVEVALEAAAHPYLLPIMLGAAAAATAGIAAYASNIPSKQEGGYVTETRPYLLHAGERVLSKESVKNNEVFLNSLKERFIPSLDTGGTITREGVYNLGVGETVIPAGGGSTLSTFNFETHLHIETDLDAALNEQNRRIKNEYRRNAP
jgi:hypothetical protein